MMQNSTDRNKKKIAPIIVTIFVILYMLPVIIVAVLTMLGIMELGVGPAPVLAIVLYLVLGGAVIGGILLALRQRLREIDGGEEEDAQKY